MKLKVLLVLLAASVFGVNAQTTPTWDSSGNSQLNGTYFFREVTYVVGDFVGNLSQAVSLYGTISFDGNGGYTLNGSVFDSGSSPLAARPYTFQGTYTIAASGSGFLSSPLVNGQQIYGLVSNGVFAGSTTEGSFQDLFVAAAAGESQATVASLQGPYTMAHFDFPGSSAAQARNALVRFTADGAGNITTPVNITGYITGAGTSAINQSAGSVSYRFASGIGTLSFPAGTLNASTLIVGDKQLYISPDGNLIFGGSATAWDFFVGVRSGEPVPPSSFGGLYYQAGLDHDASNAASGFAVLDAYYGSFQARDGRIIGHQRVNSAFADNSIDYTYSDGYTVNEDGSYDPRDDGSEYFLGSAGAVRIGFGHAPFLGIQLAVRSPEFSGSGVFLHPAGIVNAASSAPFTSSLSAGELITLYGVNLAPDLEIAAAIPFPTSLQGVQVMINDRAAPLYFVSPGQVSAIVPAATEAVARIQVVNNGETSNAITAFMGFTSPGVFTVPPGGIGQAAALHADYSLVTTDNPAQIGEIIAVYVSGLGATFPAVADGDAGPSTSPFSQVLNRIRVRIGGQPAGIGYAGLAPGLAGLYQINVQIPNNVSSGDVPLAVTGPDSFAAQVVVPVAGGTGSVSSEQSHRTSKGVRTPDCSSCRLPQVRFRWTQ